MDDSIRRVAAILGASGIEGSGGHASFSVTGADGARLKVSINRRRQRAMVVLSDAAGVTRADVDVGPVRAVTEDAEFPGRVILHLGDVQVRIDSKPTLAVEVMSDRS